MTLQNAVTTVKTAKDDHMTLEYNTEEGTKSNTVGMSASEYLSIKARQAVDYRAEVPRRYNPL